ncbi:DNA-directed RNA polymerase subunit H [bacterium]|nr:DNA-directed RNA polymerase subunit H [bacterium]
MTKKVTFNIFENELVPKHEILSEEEKQKLLERLNITDKQLPKILEKDPAVQALGAKKGDVIKITRRSPTAGIYYYYRLVI